MYEAPGGALILWATTHAGAGGRWRAWDCDLADAARRVPSGEDSKELFTLQYSPLVYIIEDLLTDFLLTELQFDILVDIFSDRWYLSVARFPSGSQHIALES